jgi:hypothetical protein
VKSERTGGLGDGETRRVVEEGNRRQKHETEKQGYDETKYMI